MKEVHKEECPLCKNRTKSLSIFCNNLGNKWTWEISTYRQQDIEETMIELRCSSDEGSKEYSVSEFWSHFNIRCPKNDKLKCTLCNDLRDFTRKQLWDHILNECLKAEMKCSFCSEILRRDEQETHNCFLLVSQIKSKLQSVLETKSMIKSKYESELEYKNKWIEKLERILLEAQKNLENNERVNSFRGN